MLNIKGNPDYFSNHALKRMQERNIPEEWVQQTLLNPDQGPEYDDIRDNYRYDKVFRRDEMVYPIRVIVDENFRIIVTVEYRD
jgi:hypothetical protein